MPFRPFLRVFLRAPRPVHVRFGRPVVLQPLHSRIGILPILAGVVGLSGAAYYGTKTAQGPSGQLPSLPTVVTVLDLETTTAKLREEEYTGTFGKESGSNIAQHGTFFRVRLPSNHPVEDEYVYGTAPGAGGKPWEFWGVFDGHAGWATSAVLKQSLIPYVSQYLKALPSSSTSDNAISAVKQAFNALDMAIFSNARSAMTANPTSASTVAAIAPAIAGSCALLTLYNPQTSTLLTACVGDSRAVFGRYDGSSGSHTCEALSVDQTGKNPSEYTRVMSQHPGEPDCVNPTSGRILGLAITRAFGDSRWKWSTETQSAALEKFFAQKPLPGAKTPPYLTAEPEVTETRVGNGDFVIMASDGLWDHMSSEDAVACVSAWVDAVRAGTIVPSSEAEQHPPFRRSAVAAPASEDVYELEDGRYADWKGTPKHFVVEDSNAATHLVKNAFGGSRRGLFTGAVTSYPPLSRYVRDDVTVQVIFFGDVLGKGS